MTAPPSPPAPPSAVARAVPILEAALSELGVEPSPALVGSLAALAALLESWSARIHLTGHKTLEAMVQGLIVEALAVERAMPSELASIVDVGSGAGFPGLPVALLRPSCRVTLLEPRERRHHFQKAAIRDLAVGNVRALRGRSGTAPATPYAGAIAQALADPGVALGWLRDWVEVGGYAMLALSDPWREFTVSPDFEPIAPIRYQVPLTGKRRALWLARRIR